MTETPVNRAVRSDIYLDETDELRRQRLARLARPAPMNSLVASAQRITKATIADRRGFGKVSDWQNDAWDMYDLVGEFRFVASTIAARMSQARFYVGKVNEDSTQPPTPLDADEDLAAEAFSHFGNTASARQQMIERMGINLFTSGDGWFVGIPQNLMPDSDDDTEYDDDPTTRLDDLEWRMLSVTEVTFDDRRVTIKIGGDKQDTITVDPDLIMLIRVWRPHPRKWWEADSPARATLAVLRELVSLTMHISAQVDSRLAGAGILVVPASAKRSIALATGVDPDGDDDPFTEALMEAMMTAIQNRDSAAALVPLVVVVPDEATGLFQHITFSTPLDGEARNLRDEAIRRLALGLDAPPELLLGVADMNHWGAWLVQEDVVTTHVEPPLALICDAITTQFLHPVLRDQGMDDDAVEEYVVWYDVDHLIQRPTRLADAIQLHSVQAIGDAALRDAGGFGDDDAPPKINRAVEIAVQVAQANPALIDNLPDIVAAFESILNPAATNVATIPDAPTEDLLSPAQNAKPTNVTNVTNENGPPQTEGNPPPSEVASGAHRIAALSGVTYGYVDASGNFIPEPPPFGEGGFAAREQWRNPHNGRWIDMPDVALGSLIDTLDGDDADRIQTHLNTMKASDGPDSPEYRQAVSDALDELDGIDGDAADEARLALEAFDTAYIAAEQTDIGTSLGTADDPIDVAGDLDLAVRLLGEGKHIRINKVDQVGTLLEKLAEVVRDAEEKGDQAPLYDLCKVSVPKTNLFCAESKGVPRVEMPQLRGVPLPGTPADAMPRVTGATGEGRVDLAPAFRDELARRGVKIEKKEVPASWLKASQAELDGRMVAGMMKSMESGAFTEATIFATRDGYVIDGHHRWAAKVGIDSKNGHLGDVRQPVEMLDMEIGEALDFAREFSARMGLASKGMGTYPSPVADAQDFRPATPEERKSLKVPPAWTDVEINQAPGARVVVRGKDAAGRRQARYSAEHTEAQAATKFARMQALDQVLPDLDVYLKEHAEDDTAKCLTLIRRMGLRPGSTKDTKAKKQAFGATTIQARHVRVTPGGKVSLRFIGKDGVALSLPVTDPEMVDMLKAAVKAKGSREPVFNTDERKVNAMLKDAVGADFKVKDLRTYLANERALEFMSQVKGPPPANLTQFRKARLAIGKQVAAVLGNTPQMALGSYINGAVFADWEAGLDRPAAETPEVPTQPLLQFNPDKSEGFTPDEVKALQNYQVHGYRDINEGLRDGKGYEYDDSEASIAAIDSLMARSQVPADTVQYRGLYPDENGNLPDWLAPGTEFTDKGFTSTSESEDYVRRIYAEAESGGVLLRIKVPAGTHALYLDQPANLGENFQEHELLLNRGTRFKITGMTPGDGVDVPTTYDVEVVQ
jgi:DNA topoisomerase IB